jgi:hypothetical protein
VLRQQGSNFLYTVHAQRTKTSWSAWIRQARWPFGTCRSSERRCADCPCQAQQRQRYAAVHPNSPTANRPSSHSHPMGSTRTAGAAMAGERYMRAVRQALLLECAKVQLPSVWRETSIAMIRRRPLCERSGLAVDRAIAPRRYSASTCPSSTRPGSTTAACAGGPCARTACRTKSA